ncbi:hypothetical protein A2926_02240 [Candidatus Giovannonibacteria bacterium RIFCSPLOWO2_01_FULL_44_40]|uniref:glucose-6-phosphate isomerase n=1 Tax=Candidatus Giovannonibacteria bacterium RIFCSPHIGHO2_01_FULL_45_23 TaxID=1798325 RepID=A0A1F5VGF3_9BACT|nr:MAG: hypothetical protein A2834_03660 [Candidatus Giovannonibacteria bacterium RIFCSPHIGHO2_01_FULL_45_23]OGF75735.1 MAG: hypothetical protein A3C77_01675 [Candidatus Giovannonibacteria bacterium RIFCSPHIGHO2_02_FULL_45_13]OGF79972.1 MAG: hypothetical protein A2926_02240 [Candidatus Giovannonibacteria bacterium RIFCSPLOWO2_01_FULL_44_40]
MSGKYFTNEMRKGDVSQRTVFDMKPVLYQPNEAKTNDVFYNVYRNLEIIGGKLRYDITEIPQRKIGVEFAKTFGHYHKGIYPELYEVLDGRAYFLLQRYGNSAHPAGGDPAEIKEAYIVEASAGAKAVMPPGFGHLSINIGNVELVLGNWIGLAEYDYETIKKLRGGCYYVLDRGKNMEFEQNPNYKSVPKLKKIKLRDLPEFGIKNDKEHPILDLKNEPQKLEWLVNPEKYLNLLTIEKLYKEI